MIVHKLQLSQLFTNGALKRRAVVLSVAAFAAAAAFAEGSAAAGMAARRSFREAVAAGGKSADAAIESGLKSDDPFIRRAAVWEWYSRNGAESQRRLLGFLEKMSVDRSDAVVSAVVDISKAVSDVEARNRLLSGMLAKAEGDFQKKYVAAAFQFPFQRDNVALSADPGNDHLMVKAWGMELPNGGWLFRTDPAMNGHLPPQEWFKPGYVPGKEWMKVSVPAWFEKYKGVDGYDGVVWYILDFELPAKPNVGKAEYVVSEELAFAAVDEEAWVWLNGEYVGQHCEGINGWNRPFRFDVQREIRWGAKNRLVVRVSDTNLGGGIHKPVSVEVMK